MAALEERRPTLVTGSGRRLALTALGFGGAPLGNMNRILSEVEAERVVEAAWETGVRYFDTAPLYGHGLSEQRIGRVVRGKSRTDFVISTKVGRLLEQCAPGQEESGIYLSTPPVRVLFDYTRDGVLRSLEASLSRLGLDRVDIVYVHDVEPRTHGSRAAYEAKLSELLNNGGWRALQDLRAGGAVGAIGIGVNEVEPCLRLLELADPDLFLLAGRYTLLEQTALQSLLPACAERGVRVVIGGPYNSGILARNTGSYDYRAAPPEIVARARALELTCREFDAPLAAAALQFASAHPVVASVIPGAQSVGEVAANAALLTLPLPAALWVRLKATGLIAADAPTPGEAAPVAC